MIIKSKKKYQNQKIEHYQKQITSLQIDYINQNGNEMKSEYLENCLSKEEVDLRQKIYG